MARRRGRAWGNALGGWRKQRRNRKGQFSSGGGSSKAVARRKKSSSKAVAKRKKPSRKARKHARLSQDRVIRSTTLIDLDTGRVSRNEYVRTGYQQRSVTRHALVGAAAGTVALPGVGTYLGAVVGARIGEEKNPARMRRMPI